MPFQFAGGDAHVAGKFGLAHIAHEFFQQQFAALVEEADFAAGGNGGAEFAANDGGLSIANGDFHFGFRRGQQRPIHFGHGGFGSRAHAQAVFAPGFDP